MKISSLQLCTGGWELKLHLYPQMRLSYKHYISSIAMPLSMAAISDCVLSLLIQSSTSIFDKITILLPMLLMVNLFR